MHEQATTMLLTELAAASEAHESALVGAEERKRLAKRWHPPCDAASRSRALGEDDTPLASCWKICAPLPLPRPGDWLAKGQPGEKDRAGQTVTQFNRPGRAVPSQHAKYIYLVPVGNVTGAPPVRTLVDWLQATYCLTAYLHTQKHTHTHASLHA